MKKVRKTEWIKLYPVKKLILVLVWLFMVLVIYAAIVGLWKEWHFSSLAILIVFSVGAIWSFTPIKRYVITPYRCMPYFNGVLTKKEMEDLIEEEEFKKVEELIDTSIRFCVRESNNWFRVNGRYISKEMAVLAWTEATSDVHNRDHTPACFMYFTGDLLKIDMGIKIPAKEREEFKKYLHRETKIIIGPGGLESRQEQEIAKDLKMVYQQNVGKGKSILEVMKDSESIKKLCRQQLPADVMGYHEWLSGPMKM